MPEVKLKPNPVTAAGIIAADVLPVVPFNHPAMKTAAQLLARYGNPMVNQAAFEKKWMTLWDIPQEINDAIKALPNKLYCNKDIVARLEKTFRDLIKANLHSEIKTFDGCFVVRKQRGANSISRHSWGVAVDLNAAWNPLNGKVTWSNAFLNIWRNNGWICGADFRSRKDGMHFENTAATAW